MENLTINEIISKFENKSKLNKCFIKDNNIKFILDENIKNDCILQLKDIFHKRETVLFNGLDYKIESYSLNRDTTSIPSYWLEIDLKEGN